MPQYDRILFSCYISILLVGLVMVASSSVGLADRLQLPMFYFAKHHTMYLILGLVCCYASSTVPIEILEKYSHYILLFSMALLTILLLPGVAKPINGSVRWLRVYSISVQPSEIMKLAIIIYMAGYMVRRNFQMKTTLQGFLIPMLVLATVALLLLLEPDFGAVVVIASTILGMLFLGGVQLRHFMVMMPLILCVMVFLAFSSSYRVQRFIAFRDPWADQFDSGYQLVQSLIAFGRGSIFGTGLGGSIQKLSYLPEAHSDFIFAVIAEELGLVGAIGVLSLYAIFMWRAMEIGRKAQLAGQHYAGNLAYGIGLLITLQMIINIGVNVGLLPTKGLTLPLISAGGSSLVIACLAIGILFRVDFETKLASDS